jgi:hypothetical protein
MRSLCGLATYMGFMVAPIPRRVVCHIRGKAMLKLFRKRAYKMGSRIVATVDIEVVPWDAEDGVAAGDHGQVIDIDPETGDLTILMDRPAKLSLCQRRRLLPNTA